MAGRSRRPRPSTPGPRLPAARLWLQACPRLQPRCRQQVGSCGTQPAPSASSSFPGACVAGSWRWRPTTKSTRVHPGYWSVAPFRSRCCHRRQRGCPPFCFLSFLLFSLFRSLRRFFSFLTAVTFVSDGGSSLVRAFGSGNSFCGSSSNNAGREVQLPSRPSAPFPCWAIGGCMVACCISGCLWGRKKLTQGTI